MEYVMPKYGKTDWKEDNSWFDIILNDVYNRFYKDEDVAKEADVAKEPEVGKEPDDATITEVAKEPENAIETKETLGGYTHDLDSFREETGQDYSFTMKWFQELLTVPGDGVAIS
ncbi:hypothetical protein Tco_1191904 [Tanacetum coccineum]